MKKSAQHALMQLAKNALHRHFSLPVSNPVDLSLYPELKVHGGAFVSLYLHGELHGCVGHIARDLPLATVVQKMALATATADPRFEPLQKEGMPYVTLEISVLSPFELTEDFSAIKVGTHGLFVEAKGQHGLLLPQVAERYQWTTEEFLCETCIKAGLPGQAFRDPDAKISTFTATVIKE